MTTPDTLSRLEALARAADESATSSLVIDPAAILAMVARLRAAEAVCEAVRSYPKSKGCAFDGYIAHYDAACQDKTK